jgi:acetyl-CoA C-acetyltransferase
VFRDERPSKLKPEKVPALKPAFKADGVITAASSSANADGAAAMVLMRESTARRMGAEPLARIVGHAVHAQEPAWFTTAPVFAIRKLLEQVGWSAGEVGLYEINEAFAVVALASVADLGLTPEQVEERVNVNGGAIALGHPVGMSGTRLALTLALELRRAGGGVGAAALCGGGGQGDALLLRVPRA